MSTAAVGPRPAGPGRDHRAAIALGVVLFLLLAVVLLTWSKWAPYTDRARTISDTDAYPGSNIFDTAGAAGDGPSLAGAWDFTKTYFTAIWQALLAGTVLAAALDALLPRRWIVGALTGHGRMDAVRAGLASMPSMMCSCCTAPVAATLRRCGVSTPAALAYWLGNPLLNPAVLVFLALLLPWQWVVVRVLVGGALVFVATSVVVRLTRGTEAPEALLPDAAAQAEALEDPPLREAPVRMLRTMARLVLLLGPELLVLVFLVGLLRGWLLPIDAGAPGPALVGLLVAVVLGTLLVIPTGGEIPIVLALGAAGVSPLVLGALLITLPALSVCSMAMVARALTSRVVLATAGAVAVGGLAGGAMLAALGG